MTPKELNREIMAGIDNSEYFLGILTEKFAKAVEWEIQVALQNKPFENIILLVKDNEETRESWQFLLKDIEIKYQIKGKTVWYIKYDNLEDFEEILRREIMLLISQKHKENGATFL